MTAASTGSAEAAMMLQRQVSGRFGAHHLGKELESSSQVHGKDREGHGEMGKLRQKGLFQKPACLSPWLIPSYKVNLHTDPNFQEWLQTSSGSKGNSATYKEMNSWPALWT